MFWFVDNFACVSQGRQNSIHCSCPLLLQTKKANDTSVLLSVEG